MRVKSSVYPKRIEILKTKDNFSTIALRRNINSIVEKDSLMNEDIHLYEYDEVKVKTRHRGNIINSIKDDFDAWFTKGVNLEELQKEIEQRQKETKELIEQYKQIDVNNEVKELNEASFGAIADLYMARNELTNSKDELEESNLIIMNAIADIYNMITKEG